MCCGSKTPVVGIIMGSNSDMPAMEPRMPQVQVPGTPSERMGPSALR